MKSYSEMLKDARKERPRSTAEDHLKDIATLLAILCDRIDSLDGSIDWLTEMIKIK